MIPSAIRQNFPTECATGLNTLANMELHVGYVYTAMAFNFDRDDAALTGFYDMFQQLKKTEHDNVEKIFSYQNLRGGRVLLHDIAKPPVSHWSCGLEAVEAALQLEKSINQAALDLHEVADQHRDKATCDWLESEFLQEKVESIKKLSEYITNLKKVGPGQGEYMFERETLN